MGEEQSWWQKRMATGNESINDHTTAGNNASMGWTGEWVEDNGPQNNTQPSKGAARKMSGDRQ